MDHFIPEQSTRYQTLDEVWLRYNGRALKVGHLRTWSSEDTRASGKLETKQ